jgi:hypothetical protein
MRHVRPEHPPCQHGYSLSHRCCSSQSGIVSRVHPSSVTHYFPFLARGVAVIIKSTAVLTLNVRKKALEDDVVEVLK